MMPLQRKIRVGIDVGGTFTDVVAIDGAARELIGRVKVPTTHQAREGVAAGIVAGIERLLNDPSIDAADVAFIAHSTTQATNALLEGDLARVGVVGLLDGLAWLSKRQMRFGAVPLPAGSRFAPGVCLRARVRRGVGARGRRRVDRFAEPRRLPRARASASIAPPQSRRQ